MTKGNWRSTHRANQTSFFLFSMLAVLVSAQAFGQFSLPTSLGWSALPSATALANSGACPPNNFGGDSYQFASNCKYVIRAWSGAIADTANNRLLLFGGGSGNYYGNEIYALDLTSGMLTRIKDPTTPTNYSTRSNCPDGIPTADAAPNSRASYGGMAYIASTKALFLTGGSLACSAGNGTTNTWTIPLSGLSNSTPWHHADPTLTGTPPGINGGTPFGITAEFDPNSGLVFVADQGALYTYNYASNTYSRITPNYGFMTARGLSVVIDPSRKLFLAMGNCQSGTCSSGTGVFVADISNPGSTTQQNWTANTLADANCSEFLSGGSAPSNTSSSPGLAFDPVTSTMVGWPNEGNSVYIITPDPTNKRLTCQKQTFANGPPNSAMSGANTTTGTYNRFRYFPAQDAFVLINDWSIPAYILRLRTGTTSGPGATLTPNALSFPQQVQNTKSQSQTVTLTNNGNAQLLFTGTGINTSAHFSQTNTCNLADGLAPLNSCVISVFFTPTSTGSFTGTLTVTDNSTSGTQSVTLSGTGVTAPAPALTLSPSPVPFGNQPLGVTSSPQSVEMTNSGNASLNINTISASGDYQVSGTTCGTLPATLAASGSCAITVVFKPKMPGPDNGTLTIADNAGTGTQQDTLTGTGIAIRLNSISVAPANDTVTLGATVQYTATGTYSDGSTQNITPSVSWSSSNSTVAGITNAGLATANTTGSTTISATSGPVVGSTGLTVSTNSLPTGIGWHALSSDTSLQGSGACPPNYFEGDPYTFSTDCANVIRAWNGAIADTKRNHLVIFGGGHSNYYGNEIYVLDLMANPPILTRAKDPTIPTNWANRTNCVDGIPASDPDLAPNSREDYNGLVYMPNYDRLFVNGGSVACNPGNAANGTWTISLAGLSNSTLWTHENLTLMGTSPPAPGDGGGGEYGVIADYDPNSGLVVLSDGGSLFTYDYSTNKYTQVNSSYGFWTSIYLSGLVDPSRKLFIALGNCSSSSCTSSNNGIFVSDISNPASPGPTENWTLATLADSTCAEFLAGGVNPINASYPGLAFDPVTNTIVGWPNQGNSVYVLTPDTTNQRMTCQKLTFANGPPNSAHSNNTPDTSYGTFGRFRYFPSLDAFILVNDWNIPAYVLRLR